MRRLFIAGAAAALGIGATVAAVPSGAAGPHGLGCQLSGVAKISPGLSTSVKATKFTFTGKLSGCKSSDAKLSSGKVAAAGAGQLSCAGGSTKGLATIRWNTGKTSTISFTTNGLANGDQLQFTTKKSTESGLARGDQGAGGLAFTSFKGDCTSGGVTSAQFQGVSLAGGPS
jgi:hypothetical protein